MRIAIGTIRDRGTRVQAGLGDVWAVQAAQAALETPPTELRAELLLERQGTRIHVSGELHATGSCVCERCGSDTLLTVEGPVRLAYAPVEPAAPSGEFELEDTDLDLGWYEEDALDLGAVLTEAFALALPTRVTCSDTGACELRAHALLMAPKAQEAMNHPAFSMLKHLVTH